MSGQWALRFPGEDPVEFSDDSGVFLRDDPELQQYDITDQDVNTDGVDGTQFGVDTHGGATYAIDFGIVGSSPDDARDREGELKRLWRGDSIRSTPDAVAELISPRGRSSFGRPRRIATSGRRYFEYPPAADVGAEWRAADALWYGEQQSADVGLVPEVTGGLMAPLEEPLTIGAGPSTESTTFTVDTDAATWLSIRVRGAILNPIVSILGPGFRLVFAFAIDLAYDDEILLTTVPWDRGAVRKNSGGVVPLGSGSSRFDSAALPSGTYELVLTGTSPAGTPRAFVGWRDAHPVP
ncbi:hypothetical protein [Curtobacterium sp. VKM Ac-2884]|uniref:hypothetical protein n=1 Tax=Curtobacterium sp. VKM Ac-2884 TaxID=2783818 RepID=UPI00188C0BD2|nr:hypothetical protein [Curtobacterium sp. VKM Ac-2884]MBF4602839.1 hypothetical protein [Curtobacterium sp. VKM Ac-2884]